MRYPSACLALAILLGLADQAPASEPAPPGGASAHTDERQYASWEHSDAATRIRFRLTMPADLEVVRGILVFAPFSGGDTREYYKEVWFREFLHLHGFAFLGAENTRSSAEHVRLMERALRQIAAISGHPELVHAPYVATGFSAGGGFASRLLVESPQKMIAAVIVGSRLNLSGVRVTAAHRGTPVCIINGDDEHGENEAGGMAASVEPVLAEHRPQGALWGWMAVQDLGHARDVQEVLAMPILDAAVRMRYPSDGDVRKGPVRLKPIDPGSGWVADNATWKSGLTAMAPAKRFKGNLGKSSWLLDRNIAFIYRAYSTFNRPLRIVSPQVAMSRARTLCWDADSTVTIRVDDSRFSNWAKLELFDGAKKVGERLKKPAEFTVHHLKPGCHAYSILGTDEKGTVRPSNPVLVVVRRHPGKKP